MACAGRGRLGLVRSQLNELKLKQLKLEVMEDTRRVYPCAPDVWWHGMLWSHAGARVTCGAAGDNMITMP